MQQSNGSAVPASRPRAGTVLPGGPHAEQQPTAKSLAPPGWRPGPGPAAARGPGALRPPAAQLQQMGLGSAGHPVQMAGSAGSAPGSVNQQQQTQQGVRPPGMQAPRGLPGQAPLGFRPPSGGQPRPPAPGVAGVTQFPRPPGLQQPQGPPLSNGQPSRAGTTSYQQPGAPPGHLGRPGMPETLPPGSAVQQPVSAAQTNGPPGRLGPSPMPPPGGLPLHGVSGGSGFPRPPQMAPPPFSRPPSAGSGQLPGPPPIRTQPAGKLYYPSTMHHGSASASRPSTSGAASQPEASTSQPGNYQSGRPAPFGQASQGMSHYGMPPQPPPGGFRPPGGPSVGGMNFQARPSTPQLFRGGATAEAKSGSSSARIDPASMPRPQPRPDEAQNFPTRLEGKPMLPLPADHPITVQDMGNASPRAMRMTVNCVPSSGDLLQSSSMPFAVSVQPLAPPLPGDSPLQIVDAGEGGPIRCGRCKAYVNPFIQWLDAGRRFRCNFCAAVNETPHDDIENVGADGRRRDADERPELSCGSVEFVATSQFMVRPPMPPTHLFLIDVSHSAVSTGATAAVCSSVARILDDLQGGERVRVGIATFDSVVHFYNLRASQSQPQMLVVPDVDEVYSPMPAGLLVPLHSSRHLVDALLEQIPRLFAANQALDGCGTAAIEAAVQVLKAGVGGKLHAFISTLPKVGARALVMRDMGSRANVKEPLKVMESASKEYRILAELAAENLVSIDLFILAQHYVDVATLGQLTQTTSGQLYLYQPFNQAAHSDTLFNDLRWNIVRPQGWEAVGRLRVSEGLVVEKYMGPHYRRTMTDLDMATVNADTSVLIQLRHSDRLPDNHEAYLQFALLYSTPEGHRRIRVHTLGLPITSVMGTLFRGADMDTQVNFLARSLAMQVPGGKLSTIQEQAFKAVVEVLYTYRSKCASASASGQLILPESLKLLPLYSLALSKCPALRMDAATDLRAAWLIRLLSLSPARTLPLIYPRLLPFGHLLSNLPQDLAQLSLPPAIAYLSAGKLSEDGIFLLENGFEAYLHFAPRVAPDLLVALLGVPNMDMLAKSTPQQLTLPVLNTAPSKALHALIDLVCRQRGRFLPVQVLPPMPPTISPFFGSLVEDNCHGSSYVTHLCDVHRAIQRKFQ